MDNRYVCNLKPFITFRFILGVSQISIKSRRIIFLVSKLLTLFIAATMIYIQLNSIEKTNLTSRYAACTEYCIYVIISIITRDKYIYKYNEYLQGVDNLPGALTFYKRLNIFLNVVISLSTIYRAVTSIIFYNEYHLFLTEDAIEAFMVPLMWLALDTCRITYVYIFTLLYCRVKLITKSLEADSGSLHNRFSVDNYVQKYLMVVESIRAIDYPLTMLIAIYLVCATKAVLLELLRIVEYFKSNDPNIISLIGSLFHCCRPAFPLLLASIALDLATDNIDHIKVMLVKKRIRSVNERQRSEVNHMLRILEHHPLNYTVYRAVPITVHTSLSVLSFTIINCMAYYQIRSFS